MVFKWKLLWAAILSVIPVASAQSAWGPDEIKSTNRPYELPTSTVLKAETNLVEIAAVVRDSRGRAVGSLTKDDFTILDDGKKRDITAFSIETSGAANEFRANAEAPNSGSSPAKAAGNLGPIRFVVLYFDDYSISSGDLARTKIAAARLIREGLRPGDRVAIATTSSPVLDFTDDPSKALDAIAKLSAHPRVNSDGIVSCPRITPYQAFRIVSNDPVAEQAAIDELYVCMNGPPPPPHYSEQELRLLRDSVRSQSEGTWQQAKQASQETLAAIESVVDAMARLAGTRVVVLASSGFLTGTLEFEESRIVDHAVRAGVVINSLDAKGLYTEGADRQESMVHGGDLPQSTFMFEQTTAGVRNMDANAGMSDLAESTGGWFFQNRNDLDAGFQLGLRPETSYLLGFSPADLKPDGKFHKLKVRLSQRGSYYVAARPGYFAPAPIQGQPAPAQRKIDQAVTTAEVSSEVPARFVAEPKIVGDRRELSVTLIVDVRQLKFDLKDARHVQTLSFIAALFDKDGNFVIGKEGQIDFALKDATYDRFANTGISTRISLSVPPGEYRLRGVVQESLEEKMTASNQAVKIP